MSIEKLRTATSAVVVYRLQRTVRVGAVGAGRSRQLRPLTTAAGACVRSYRKILETIAAEKVGDGKLGDKVIKFDILGMADEVLMTTMDGALKATGP
jgi:hypothetical protein